MAQSPNLKYFVLLADTPDKKWATLSHRLPTYKLNSCSQEITECK